jgi:hypothetical protein
MRVSPEPTIVSGPAAGCRSARGRVYMFVDSDIVFYGGVGSKIVAYGKSRPFPESDLLAWASIFCSRGPSVFASRWCQPCGRGPPSLSYWPATAPDYGAAGPPHHSAPLKVFLVRARREDHCGTEELCLARHRLPLAGTGILGGTVASCTTLAVITVRTIVLHNPTAGSGDVSAEDLLAALTAGGIASRYCSTKQPDFADALGEPADLIVAAGGDGTVLEVISHVRDRSIPIAILPLGGANNIARSLGMATDPLGIARAGWRETEVLRLDVGTAAGPWGERLFVESVGSARSRKQWPQLMKGISPGPRRPRWRAKGSSRCWRQRDRWSSG